MRTEKPEKVSGRTARKIAKEASGSAVRLKCRLAVLGIVILVLLLFGGGMLGVMMMNATIVHVAYADVYMQDLPDVFDGITILFAADLHISRQINAARTEALFSQLQTLHPDLLLLGGDYSDVGLPDVIAAGGRKTEAYLAKAAEVLAERNEFLASLANFDAPLGKYAVVGNHELLDDEAGIGAALAAGNVTLLKNESAEITRNGSRMTLIGLDDWLTGENAISAIAKQVKSGDCTIVLSHDPDALPVIHAEEASDGGAWADLILSGHTHGGQVGIFSWYPANPSRYGERFRTGWNTFGNSFALTSNGVGTTLLPVRLFADAQVHMITIHTK